MCIKITILLRCGAVDTLAGVIPREHGASTQGQRPLLAKQRFLGTLPPAPALPLSPDRDTDTDRDRDEEMKGPRGSAGKNHAGRQNGAIGSSCSLVIIEGGVCAGARGSDAPGAYCGHALVCALRRFLRACGGVCAVFFFVHLPRVACDGFVPPCSKRDSSSGDVPGPPVCENRKVGPLVLLGGTELLVGEPVAAVRVYNCGTGASACK